MLQLLRMTQNLVILHCCFVHEEDNKQTQMSASYTITLSVLGYPRQHWQPVSEGEVDSLDRRREAIVHRVPVEPSGVNLLCLIFLEKL